MQASSILPHTPDLRYLAQIIQLAVAPVFLLAGLGAFLNVCAGRLARIVARCQAIPGETLFQYEDEDGVRQTVDSADVNGYLREITGQDFTAKDFRTWAGTLIRACCLASTKLDVSAPKKDRKRAAVEAVKRTAQQLGNTPAICKSSYIYPSILSAFDKGKSLEAPVERLEDLVAHRQTGLLRSERALIKLLGKAAA